MIFASNEPSGCQAIQTSFDTFGECMPKLKGFWRIATRYGKLAFTYMGFVCLASSLIWIK